jgi:hypothetical protein
MGLKIDSLLYASLVHSGQRWLNINSPLYASLVCGQAVRVIARCGRAYLDVFHEFDRQYGDGCGLGKWWMVRLWGLL